MEYTQEVIIVAKTSEARIRANKKYKLKRYETVSVSSPREMQLNALLDQGAKKAGISKAAYIFGALYDRLQRDGITQDYSEVNYAPGQER